MLSTRNQQGRVKPQMRQSAKALLTAADRVLLVKERHGDGSEFWTLPGGGVERGESLTEALSRELFEELRCPVDIGRRVRTLWYAHVSSSLRVSRWQVYRCWTPGKPTPAHDDGILDSRWVRWTDLPSNTLTQVRYLLQRCDSGPIFLGSHAVGRSHRR